MKNVIAWFNTVTVAIVLTAVLAFAGVYFTTLMVFVIAAEVATYNLTLWALNALKKTEC